MNAQFIILYVDSPTASAAFYSKLLGQPPVEASPTFAMFALSAGVMLGVWSRRTVSPLPANDAHPGSSEVAFTVDSIEAVEKTHAEWKAKGLPIALAPTKLDFGYSFVALDPDGHRLRVFAPGA